MRTPTMPAPKPLPFGSATWQALDSSKVWAQVLNDELDSRRNPPELPERRLDSLPAAAVHRLATRAVGREHPDEDHLHPALEHTRRSGAGGWLHDGRRCRKPSAGPLHCGLLLLPQWTGRELQSTAKQRECCSRTAPSVRRPFFVVFRVLVVPPPKRRRAGTRCIRHGPRVQFRSVCTRCSALPNYENIRRAAPGPSPDQ